jgi:hypothetical protein
MPCMAPWKATALLPDSLSMLHVRIFVAGLSAHVLIPRGRRTGLHGHRRRSCRTNLLGVGREGLIIRGIRVRAEHKVGGEK